MQIRDFVRSMTATGDDTLVICRQLKSEESARAILAREARVFFQPWASWARTPSAGSGW